MRILKRKLDILKKRSIKKKINNFFGWISGAELIELKSCNVSEDPVRPELDEADVRPEHINALDMHLLHEEAGVD